MTDTERSIGKRVSPPGGGGDRVRPADQVLVDIERRCAVVARAGGPADVLTLDACLIPTRSVETALNVVEAPGSHCMLPPALLIVFPVA